jgi:hypothetical protein
MQKKKWWKNPWKHSLRTYPYHPIRRTIPSKLDSASVHVYCDDDGDSGVPSNHSNNGRGGSAIAPAAYLSLQIHHQLLPHAG